ncbi:MAG: hypothetical protein MAG451_02757 [Anaerolineales bacterium]|nr:hypothetical protein [Anaerolineales bacterium]
MIFSQLGDFDDAELFDEDFEDFDDFDVDGNNTPSCDTHHAPVIGESRQHQYAGTEKHEHDGREPGWASVGMPRFSTSSVEKLVVRHGARRAECRKTLLR